MSLTQGMPVQRITVEDLVQEDACEQQVELFEKHFPGGLETTVENAQRAIDVGLDVEWWIARVVCPWLTGKLVSGSREYYYRDGKRHRNGGPAVIYPEGTQYYYRDGKRHRNGGPAVIYSNGTQKYYQRGKLHRVNGPAVIYSDSTQFYYQRGKLHRVDGPAVIWTDGRQEYWQNGKLEYKEP